MTRELVPVRQSALRQKAAEHRSQCRQTTPSMEIGPSVIAQLRDYSHVNRQERSGGPDVRMSAAHGEDVRPPVVMAQAAPITNRGRS